MSPTSPEEKNTNAVLAQILNEVHALRGDMQISIQNLRNDFRDEMKSIKESMNGYQLKDVAEERYQTYLRWQTQANQDIQVLKTQQTQEVTTSQDKTISRYQAIWYLVGSLVGSGVLTVIANVVLHVIYGK